MSFLAKFIGGLVALVHKKQAEQEMDEELRGHSSIAIDAILVENPRPLSAGRQNRLESVFP
jgi:hypothetical protein